MGAVYMECSAKERIGVEDIFDLAIILATSEDDGSSADDQLGMVAKQVKSRKKKMRKTCKFL
jgi:Flp pilus assembly protein TadB